MIRIGARRPRRHCSYFVMVFPCYLNHERHVLHVSPVGFIHRYMNGKTWGVNRVSPQYSPGDSLLTKEFCKWNVALTGLGQIKRMTWTRLEATTGERGNQRQAKHIDGRARPLASPCRAREDQSGSEIALLRLFCWRGQSEAERLHQSQVVESKILFGNFAIGKVEN